MDTSCVGGGFNVQGFSNVSDLKFEAKVGDGFFPEKLDVVGFVVIESQHPSSTIVGNSHVLSRERGARFMGSAKHDARWSVVIGASAGDVFEPAFVAFKETFGNHGSLFIEVVRLAGIGLHIVEFERNVGRHSFIGETGRVDELPALFAHRYVVKRRGSVAAMDLHNERAIGPFDFFPLQQR